ncbi:MAG: hypothetical protein LBB23_00785 [Rickettsiales bacterium]|nr:hypothetical protein [Rickettsiales bacterium]
MKWGFITTTPSACGIHPFASEGDFCATTSSEGEFILCWRMDGIGYWI